MTKTRVPGVAADGRGLSARSILASLRRTLGKVNPGESQTVVRWSPATLQADLRIG